MATINFSVPENVKKAFNEAFAGENKSAVPTRLLQRAVEERERQKRRAAAIEAISEAACARQTDRRYLKAAKRLGRIVHLTDWKPNRSSEVKSRRRPRAA